MLYDLLYMNAAATKAKIKLKIKKKYFTRSTKI